MSFTTEVKEEISILKVTKPEIIAELSGFIRSNYKELKKYNGFYVENLKLAKRIYSHIKEVYNVECEINNSIDRFQNKKRIYFFSIKQNQNIILQDLSVTGSNEEFLGLPQQYIASSEDEIKAYIRGSFLACGSINDPKTSRYHLEMLYDNKEESVYVQRLLNEFDLNAKILLRDKKIMIYIKDSDDISEFLKIIGASNAVMYYENVRAMKEQINITNRLNNCEQANTDKIINMCNEQINDIELIKEKLGIEFLDEKLQEAATYRLKYPESSLQELSEIISVETNKKITKSGLNHRFRKIKEISSKLDK